MTRSSLSDEQLLELLSGYCNGSLDPLDAERLAAALRNDAAVRRTFIEYTDLHNSLAWEMSSIADLDELIGLPTQSVTARTNQTDGNLSAQPGGRLQRTIDCLFGTRRRVALTVAASFLAVVLTTLQFTPAPQFESTIVTVKPAGDHVVAARVTGSVDCVWQESALPLGFGSSLYKGQQIEVISGSAEITFSSGAVVTLAGPAAYVIDSDSRSTLRYGELSAMVPHRAQGFAVQTPASLLVDLGTEFGVVVAQSAEGSPPADEEFHVFRGAVQLTLRQSNSAPLRLISNEAVRVVDGVRTERLAGADRGGFPAAIDEEGDTVTAESLPPEMHPPVTEGLAMWLAADSGIRRDAQGYIHVWEDTLTGDNNKAQNATQHIYGHRPRWIDQALGGRPVVRFDGNDFLTLATPSNLGIVNSDYEAFVVARTASPAVQFLLAGGVEDFELHVNGDAGVRFIPAGFNFAPDASDLAVSGSFNDGRPHIFAAYVHPNLDYHGKVQVDGVEASHVSSGDGRSSNNTALRLGMRHDMSYGLTGDVAEVLIFNRGLSQSERTSITGYLADKYHIRVQQE